MVDASTPLMRQYHALKQQVPHALLMFRLGDFYELFFEDAVIAARELEITLTARNKERGEPIPMAGVPHHAVEGHIAKLLQRGHRVALCEQMEDPKLARKLVRREITRIVTPGTATESSVLRSRENNYLAGVAAHQDRVGLAHVDVSTGEFRVTEGPRAEVLGLLEGLAAREVLVAPGVPLEAAGLRTELDDWVFSPEYAERILREHFRLLSLDGCGLEGQPLAVRAAGAVLHYLRDTQRSALDHLERPAFYQRGQTLILDAATVRNLELIEPLFAGESREATLVSVLDQTRSSMGARLLRRRLLQPCLDPREIGCRLDQVEALHRATIPRARLRETLGGILDLERLLAKVTLGSVSPRELLGLGRSLEKLPGLRRELAGVPGGESLQGLQTRLDELETVRTCVLTAIADEPPATLADGGTIRAGFHADLDELRDLRRNSRQYLAEIETRERARTGIQSLKVRFNNVFGYYLEISKANLHLVPGDYDRKQTLVGAERFTTPELKELEAKVLDAEERILTIERTLFQEVRATVAAEASAIRQVAAAVAELDVLAGLAEVAAEHRYTRPVFTDGCEIRIEAGRHPVIEHLMARDGGRFIPNDLHLDRDGRFLAVLTGPNMGGKSTYLRQAALLTVMAQMGSFVPADRALLPLVDRVFTRIGAADNLARGRSTFMVEMTEAAVILNTATPRSLIVLDEIGRGTSTYDGLALAWAMVEHIHERIKAPTLFATHYHELTALEEQLPGVRNLHVSVKESGEQILFLRKVEPGAADRSYGIEVARLAALPVSVIERAREILALHEQGDEPPVALPAAAPAPRRGPLQIQLFEPVNHQLAGRIRGLDLDQLRPIDALRLLQELQEELRTA